MFNLLVLLPLTGIVVAVWGIVRHNRTTMRIGLALVLAFLALGRLDRMLGGWGAPVRRSVRVPAPPLGMCRPGWLRDLQRVPG